MYQNLILFKSILKRHILILYGLCGLGLASTTTLLYVYVVQLPPLYVCSYTLCIRLKLLIFFDAKLGQY